MSIKGIGNVKFADNSGSQVTELEKQQKQKAQQLKDQLNTALAELDKGKDYYEYLTSEEQAKIRATKVRIDAEIALLDAFIETGQWGGTGTFDTYDFLADLPDLPSGWNGKMLEYMKHDSTEYDDYTAKLMESGFDSDAELADVISVGQVSYDPAVDDPSLAPVVALVIKDKDGVEKITGKTVGRDIWITVKYDYEHGGGERVYVLKGLAVRPDVKIYMYAGECTRDINMDFSGIVRVYDEASGKFGKTAEGSIIAVGGQGNDTIIGSQSNDIIIGGKGNDRLFGMGGTDWIYGDTVYKNPNGPGLISINDETGGNDFIDGGDGIDNIYGGGGAGDEVVIDQNAPADIMDSLYETENPVYLAQKAVDYDDVDNFIVALEEGLAGYGAVSNDANGEVVVTKNTAGANDPHIDITAPDGYTMAHAAHDGNDIVITFSKVEGEGSDTVIQYIRVRIKHVLANGNETHIKVTAADPVFGPAIFDFSQLKAGGNTIEMVGFGEDDILIAPTTNIDEYGLDASELGETTVSSAYLEKILDEKMKENLSGTEELYWGDAFLWSSESNVDGNKNEIVLKLKDELNDKTLDNTSLHGITLSQPKDFQVEHALYEVDDDGNLIIHVIGRHEGKDNQVFNIKIIDGAKNGFVPLIYIGGVQIEPMGTVIFDSGQGSNLIVGSINSTSDWGNPNPDDVRIAAANYEYESDPDGYEGIPPGIENSPATYDGEPVYGKDGTTILNWGDTAPAYEKEGYTVHYVATHLGEDPNPDDNKDAGGPADPPEPGSPVDNNNNGVYTDDGDDLDGDGKINSVDDDDDGDSVLDTVDKDKNNPLIKSTK